MRAFTRLNYRAPPIHLRALTAPMRRFTQASALRLKEDADRTPEELDRIKHEQVEKQRQGKGEWHEELASSSESNTAADKEK
ncbi:hypothetical protein LTR95_008602, partial [Oleoguttula sp. CCFEE 5521]